VADVASWTLVNVISSSLNHVERREAIRSTWGAVKFLDGLKIVNVFVVGRTADLRLQSELNKESDRYGDLLQFGKDDSFK